MRQPSKARRSDQAQAERLIMMAIFSSSDSRLLDRLMDRGVSRDRLLVRRVAAIVSAVRRDGDAALRRYATRFDGLAGAIEVSHAEMEDASRRVSPATRRALKAAARNIRWVAMRQRPRTNRIACSPAWS